LFCVVSSVVLYVAYPGLLIVIGIPLIVSVGGQSAQGRGISPAPFRLLTAYTTSSVVRHKSLDI